MTYSPKQEAFFAKHAGKREQHAQGTIAVDSPSPQPLTPTQQVASYIATATEHVADGSKLVPLLIFEYRRELCNACPHRNAKKDSCTLCGCKLHKTLLGDKLNWAVSRCPIGKWEKYADITEECCQ